MIKQMY